MKFLPLSRLDIADHLVTPQEFFDIEGDSPALSLMMDFRQYRPRAISASTPALWAANSMASEQVDCKLVVDRQREFIGLLSQERLSEQSLIAAQTTLGIDRESLTAADLMLPRSSMPALDYGDLVNATVADLVATAGSGRAVLLGAGQCASADTRIDLRAGSIRSPAPASVTQAQELGPQDAGCARLTDILRTVQAALKGAA